MAVTINGSAGVTTNVGAVYNGIQTSTVNAGGTNPFPSSSGPTTVDFTSIPSWVKRITVMFSGVSTNGTDIVVQIGTISGIQNTLYVGCAGIQSTTPATTVTSYTNGFGVKTAAAGNNVYGQLVLTLVDSATGLWSASGAFGYNTTYLGTSGGSKTLSGTLDRVRITTLNGTDLFDAGTINILYE